MTLFPHDLGQRWHQALLGLRLRGKPETGASSERPLRRPSFFDRFLTAGLGLDERQRTTALGEQRLNVGCSMGIAWAVGVFVGLVPLALAGEGELPLIIGAIIGVVIASMGPAAAAWLLRHQMRSLHRPLTVGDMHTLRESARDVLERAFLELVAAAIELKLDPKIKQEVVAAFQGIAEAIERLPRIDNAAPDTTTLREVAAQLMQESQAEPDEATAASIRRRAMAHLQQADAGDQCRVIGRRSEALREEILAQIQALRTALVAMQSRADDHGSLAELAEAARSLAGEAVNVAAARGEIEVLTSTQTEQPIVTVGVQSS